MNTIAARVDAILQGRSLESGRSPASGDFAQHALLAGACIVIYGAAMGSRGLLIEGASWGDGAQWLQMLFSALKAPLLLAATFALTLPGFYVLMALAGLRSDFPLVMNALVEMQSGIAIVLGGLAPFTMLWYLSSTEYSSGILFNGMMFALATFSALSLIRRHYRLLVVRHQRHRTMLRFWGLLYVFIGIQMGWILRPFIGDPGSPVSFFRAIIGNAWVRLADLFLQLLR